MQNRTEIIAALNRLLTGELTAMDVYFVQSRICQDWGYDKLYERLAHEVTDETAHADVLIQRILYLGGMPEMRARHAYDIGADVEQMLRTDLALERQVAADLNEVMALCESSADNGTRGLLEPLLVDTETDHITWLEAQLRQIGDMGLANYLQVQV